MGKLSALYSWAKFGVEVGTAIGTGVIAGAAIAAVPIPATVVGGTLLCVRMGALAMELYAVATVVDFVDETFTTVETVMAGTEEAIKLAVNLGIEEVKEEK